MYAIYGNIYYQYTPNVSIYTIHGSYGYETLKWFESNLSVAVGVWHALFSTQKCINKRCADSMATEYTDVGWYGYDVDGGLFEHVWTAWISTSNRRNPGPQASRGLVLRLVQQPYPHTIRIKWINQKNQKMGMNWNKRSTESIGWIKTGIQSWIGNCAHTVPQPQLIIAPNQYPTYILI